MKLLFVIFVLSAAAMDSESIVIPGMVCVVSLLLLAAENRKSMQKERVCCNRLKLKKLIVNLTLIIAWGKGKSNGKM